MSLGPSTYQASPKEKTKYLFLPASNPESREIEYVPRFYFEARIDFADVRSGLRETIDIARAMEIYPIDNDALWTQDMVWTIDSSSISTDKPEVARLCSLPAFVDGEFLSRLETHCLRYLLRYFEVKIIYNHAAGIFSFLGESESEFTKRCLEEMGESFRHDLDRLRETFERKLERIKEKYLNSDNWRDLEPTQMRSRLRITLHQMSESITEFFLRSEHQTLPIPAVQEGLGSEMQELGERFLSLEAEVRQAVGRLKIEYQEKASNHDEYVVHPGIKDLHLERTCILWMPARLRKQAT
jgi:hypothetical protein